MDGDAVKAECYKLIKNCLMYKLQKKKQITCSSFTIHYKQKVHKLSPLVSVTIHTHYLYSEKLLRICEGKTERLRGNTYSYMQNMIALLSSKKLANAIIEVIRYNTDILGMNKLR